MVDTTVYGDAGSFHWALGADYALARWFSPGIKFKFNRYVTEPDKTTGIKPSAQSYEILIPLNFRVVNLRRFYLLLAPELGFSSLTYQTNDPNNDIDMYGKGGYFALNVQPSFIFKKVGFYVSIFFPAVNYNSMETSSSTVNKYLISQWKGSGTGFQLGIVFRFKTKKDESGKKETAN